VPSPQKAEARHDRGPLPRAQVGQQLVHSLTPGDRAGAQTRHRPVGAVHEPLRAECLDRHADVGPLQPSRIGVEVDQVAEADQRPARTRAERFELRTDVAGEIDPADHSGRPWPGAGQQPPGLGSAPLSWWDRVIDVDLSSQFALTQLVAAPILARGSGKIVFTAGLLSFQGGINVPGYTAAKSGIAGLTRALTNEWAARGVNVNAIAPGYIATDNTAALREDADRSRSILERIPAGRWGHSADLAGAAVFLSSAASDYVSGTILPVDGGWLGR
jgi:NAD(P)-dependent dehydrogenase (short-subunit alcohol dehydrogenase family)